LINIRFRKPDWVDFLSPDFLLPSRNYFLFVPSSVLCLFSNGHLCPSGSDNESRGISFIPGHGHVVLISSDLSWSDSDCQANRGPSQLSFPL